MTNEVIYFVSDTHLGDGTSADRFKYPMELMVLLKRIEAEPQAQLVLLGDILELWACSLEGVLIQHAPIFEAIGRIALSHPVTYVVGNHDCLPWYYYIGKQAGSIQFVERFTAVRDTLIALHGHQFDPFNQVKVAEDGHVKVPWTRKLVHTVGFLSRVGGPVTGNALNDAGTELGEAARSLESLLPHWDDQSRSKAGSMLLYAKAALERESPGERGYPSAEPAYEEAARSMLRAGARFVVMGHTHHPLVRRYGNRLYMNTGCWVWDRYPPTYGRYADGRLELINARTHLPFTGEK